MKLFKKLTATVLVLTFSFSQVSWATPREMLDEAQAYFKNLEDYRRSLGTSEFQEAQSQAQGEVDQQEALQTLMNGNWTRLKTQNDDLVEYLDGVLTNIQTHDGYDIHVLGVDPNDQILDYDISYNGILEAWRGGVIQGKRQNGQDIIYRQDYPGFIEKTVAKDGTETVFTYDSFTSPNTVETDNLKIHAKYDTLTGKAIEILDKVKNITTYFDSDGLPSYLENIMTQSKLFLTKLTTSEGHTLRPDRLETPNQPTFFFDEEENITQINLSDTQSLSNLFFDESNILQDFVLTEGSSVYNFDNQILLSSQEGESLTTYTYLPDKIVTLTGNIQKEYSLTGSLLKEQNLSNGSYVIYNASGLITEERDSLGALWYHTYVMNTTTGLLEDKKYQEQLSVENKLTFQSPSNLSYSSNPRFDSTFMFVDDGTPNKKIELQAFATGKSAFITLVPGAGSTAGYNSTIFSIPISLDYGKPYKASVFRSASPLGMNVSLTDLSTGEVIYQQQVTTIANWNQKGKLTATNTEGVMDPNSSGVFNLTHTFNNTNSSYYEPGLFDETIRFKRTSTATSTSQIILNLIQSVVNGIERKVTAIYDSLNSRWLLKKFDKTIATGSQTTSTLTITGQVIPVDTWFNVKLEVQNDKVVLLVGQEGLPLTALGDRPFYAGVSAKASVTSSKALVFGEIFNNLTVGTPNTPPSPLTDKVFFLQNLTLNLPNLSDILPFSRILYNPDFSTKEVFLRDNQGSFAFEFTGIKRYDSNGVLEANLGFGEEESVLSTITQGSLSASYNLAGNLSSVVLNEDPVQVFFKEDSDQIDYIEAYGTRIYDILDDSGHSLTRVELETGEIRDYNEEDELVRLTTATDTTIEYLEGVAQTLKTVGNFIYDLNYTLPDTIQAILNTDLLPETTSILQNSLTQINYDLNWNLKQTIDSSGQIINYLTDSFGIAQIESILTPGNDPQTFERFADGSYIIHQGNIHTLYNALNQPVHTTVDPTPDRPFELKAEYQYGKIRKVYKDNILTLNYTYSSDTQTQIEDLQERALKTYEAGKLLTSLNTDTSVLSAYEYDTQDRVQKVTLRRLGRFLHEYTYSYEGGHTLVLDEEAVKRTYDSTTNKLLFLEKENTKWAYTYAPGLNNEEIITEELIQKRLDGNILVHYQDAEVFKIDLPDGTFIDSVQKNNLGVLEKASFHALDGIQTVFNSSEVLEKILPGQTHFFFKEGRIQKIITPAQKEYSLFYEKDQNQNLLFIWAKAGEAYLKYGLAGQLLGLKLSNFDSGVTDDYFSFQSMPEGFSFQGPQGNITFDTQGNLTTFNLNTGISATFNFENNQIQSVLEPTVSFLFEEGGLSSIQTASGFDFQDLLFSTQALSAELPLNLESNYTIQPPSGYSNDPFFGAVEAVSSGNTQVTFADLNNDGLNDRITHTFESGQYQPSWKVELNNSQGLDSAVTWNIGTNAGFSNDSSHGAIESIQSGATQTELIDLNGDGFLDRIYHDYSSGSWQSNWMVQLGNGQGFNDPQSWNVSVPEGLSLEAQGAIRYQNNSKQIDLIDMNNDGRPDRIYHDYSNGQWQPNLIVQLNNGWGFDTAQSWGVWTIPGASNSQEQGAIFYESDGAVYGGLYDMNGDAKPDRVWHNYENGSWQPSWVVQINNGSGFNTPQVWQLQAPAGSNDNLYNHWGMALKTKSESAVQSDLLDINGDGLPDRVTHDYSDSNGSWQPVWHIQLNTGSGFGPVQTWEIDALAGQGDAYNYWGAALENTVNETSQVKLIDLNFDGLPDRVVHQVLNGTYQPRLLVELNEGTGFGPTQIWDVFNLAGNQDEFNSWGGALEAKSNGITYSTFLDLNADFLPDRVNHLYDVQAQSYSPTLEVSLNQTNALAIFINEASITLPNAQNIQITDNEITPQLQRILLPLLKRYTLKYDKPLKAVHSLGGEVQSLLNLPHFNELNLTLDLGEGKEGEYFQGILSKLYDEDSLVQSYSYVVENSQTKTLVTEDGITFKYSPSNILEGFYLTNGSYYSVQNPLDENQTSTAQRQTLAETTLAQIESELATVTAQRNIVLAQVQALETLKQRKLSLSEGNGSQYTPAYEYPSDLAGGPGGLASSQKGWRYEYSGRFVTNYSTESHGVWFYTSNSASSPKVFVTLNQLVGYEPIPYTDLWIPPSETIDTIVQQSGSSASSSVELAGTYSSRNFNFDSDWTKLPPQIYWRTQYFSSGSANTPEGTWPSLTFGQWKYIRAHLGSIQTGWNDSGWGGYSTQRAYMVGQDMPVYLSNSFGEVATNILNLFFGYYEEDQALIPLNQQLETLTTQENKLNSDQALLLNIQNNLNSSTPSLASSIKIDRLRLKDKQKALDVLNPNRSSWASTTQESLLDSQTVMVQEYSSSGILETQTKADGTTTLFDNEGRPSEVLDKLGLVLIRYTYDAQGNPTRVYLKNARDTLPGEVLKANQQVAESLERETSRLATQKRLAVHDIKIQAAEQRQLIQNQLNTLQNQFNEVSGIQVKGKAAKSQKGDILNQIGGGIDALRGALTTLSTQVAQAYANLDTQVASFLAQLQTQANTSFAQIETQKQALETQITLQEISPIVYHWFRKILGRDPDSNEYNFWTSQIDYASGEPLEDGTVTEVRTLSGINLTQALTDYLNASPELLERQTYVQNVKDSVTNQINAYLLMTEEEKSSFIQGLGLTQNDVIDLSTSDAQKILTWLSTRSLHFGQSAFLSLEELLDQKGISYAREDIAQKAILIETLTGINSLDDGDLVISIFALNKVASLYNLTLSGANLSWEDLQNIFEHQSTSAPGTSPRIIAHINGNHYVIITNITSDSITYIDPGAGKDKQNQVVTLDKQNFLKGWRGNVTLENTLLTSSTIQNPQSKILSDQQTQKIRGAFLFFLIPAIIGAFTSIGGAISAIISGIGTMLGSLGSVIGAIFNGIGQVLGGILQGIQYIGSAIFQGISFAASSLFHAIGNVGSFLSQQIFGSLAKAGFGNALFQNAVKIGINYGVNKGLTALGVDPQIASFASAFITGTYQGLTGPISAAQLAQGVTRASLIASNIFQSLTLEGIGFIGQELNLDPQLTNIISLSVAAIGGQVIANPTTTLEEAFLNVRPDIFSSLASYGVTELASSLGLSSSFSSLLSLPISSALSAQLQGQSVITAVQQGLLSGATSIAIDYAGEELGLNPILSSLSANAFAGAISGLFGIRQIDPLNPTNFITPNNIFEGISNAFLRGVSSALTLGGPGQTPWSQAAYIQRVSSFSDVIDQVGLIQAIDIYATSFFEQSAIEQMVQISGTVGEYIQAKLADGQYETLASGNKRVSTPDDSSYIDVDDIQGQANIYAFGGESWSLEGGFSLMSDGGIGLDEGSSILSLNGSHFYQEWLDGELEFTTITDSSGASIQHYHETSDIQLIIEDQAKLLDGMVFSQEDSTYIALKNGQITQYQIKPFQETLKTYGENLISSFNFGVDAYNSFEQGRNKGVADTFLSQDYQQYAAGTFSPANLANIVVNQGQGYLETYYNVQSEQMAEFFSLFGDVGQKVDTLYQAYLDIHQVIDENILAALAEPAYFGVEIPMILDDLGNAFNAFQQGDYYEVGKKIGSIQSRLVREVDRGIAIFAIGTTLGGSIGDAFQSIMNLRNPLIARANIPLGFSTAADYQLFTNELRTGLANIGSTQPKIYFRGSSVTGVRYRSGLPFDYPSLNRSDYDLAIADPALLQRAKELGILTRSGGRRTIALSDNDLNSLGLMELKTSLQNRVGRDVSFMIYDSEATVRLRGPYISVED
jgi:hypothetical protein